MSAVGTRLTCESCGASAVVTISGDGTISCGGQPMLAGTVPTAASATATGGAQIGKRYKCATCPQVVLCVRGGPDAFACHDRSMMALAPQQLPAGD